MTEQVERTTVGAFRKDADELHRLKRKYRLESVAETIEQILENLDEEELES